MENLQILSNFAQKMLILAKKFLHVENIPLPLQHLQKHLCYTF